MMEKKELNVMELDMVAGGSFWDDVGDFFEDAADEVVDVVKDVAEPAAEIFNDAKNAQANRPAQESAAGLFLSI